MCPFCNHSADKHKITVNRGLEDGETIRCFQVLYEDANQYGDPFKVYCRCKNQHQIHEKPELT